MKTLVICILFSAAFAKPATLEEHSHRFDTIEDIPDALDTNIREKKAPALTQIRNNHPIENFELFDDGINPTEGRTLSGIKKPIIIKKKVGYRVYRDSDEEQAQADPKEKCRKQVKVKLCEDDTESNSQKREQDSTLETGDNRMSEVEMKHSIEMAKEAVEHLQRDLQIIGSSSKNQEHHLSKNSDTELHKDIEVARQVLEHIHSNFGNLQSMRLHAATLNKEDLNNIQLEQKRMAQWKESLGQENMNTLKNIEDRFETENDNDDNVKIEKRFNKIEKDDHERNSASATIDIIDKNPKDKFESIEKTLDDKERDSETSMAQDIHTKTKLQSDNLTIIPGTTTSTLKEMSNLGSSSRNTKEDEANHMKVNVKEIESDDSNAMEENKNNLNQFRNNDDVGSRNEMETQTSNKVNVLSKLKTEQMRHTDLIEDASKTNRMTKDRSFEGTTDHENMSKQHLSEQSNNNFVAENTANLNSLKSALDQNKVNQPSFEDHTDRRRTHETVQHEFETTDVTIPTQNLTPMDVNPFDTITTSKQAADFDEHVFNKNDDQFHAAAEKMDMRWAQNRNGMNFQEMRGQGLSNHALLINAPSNDQFNFPSMRNSHADHHFANGALDTMHHEHQMPSNRFAQDFDKEPQEPRLRADIMRTNTNTHSHHNFGRQHVPQLTSELAPVHGMFDKTSHADSAVEASNHMDTMHRSAAEYTQQWFTTSGMNRDSNYKQQQPSITSQLNGSGAVGLFPNANTGGCAIPLLLSCSPSVVSGTLAKSHPSYSAPQSYSAPSSYYRYHKKRETNNINGKLSLKSDHKTTLVTKAKPSTNEKQ